MTTKFLSANYSPQKLFEMIIKVERIVYGEIITLDSNTYTILIEGSITDETGTITIERFENWPCAHRCRGLW